MCLSFIFQLYSVEGNERFFYRIVSGPAFLVLPLTFCFSFFLRKHLFNCCTLIEKEMEEKCDWPNASFYSDFLLYVYYENSAKNLFRLLFRRISLFFILWIHSPLDNCIAIRLVMF
jgi:hypothetical protein